MARNVFPWDSYLSASAAQRRGWLEVHPIGAHRVVSLGTPEFTIDNTNVAVKYHEFVDFFARMQRDERTAGATADVAAPTRKALEGAKGLDLRKVGEGRHVMGLPGVAFHLASKAVEQLEHFHLANAAYNAQLVVNATGERGATPVDLVELMRDMAAQGPQKFTGVSVSPDDLRRTADAFAFLPDANAWSERPRPTNPMYHEVVVRRLWDLSQSQSLPATKPTVSPDNPYFGGDLGRTVTLSGVGDLPS